MGLIQKEKRAYIEGMKFALKVASLRGLDDLVKEIDFREKTPVPMNVDRFELTEVARLRAVRELQVIATAMADTLQNDMKIPPSVILEYLRKFNSKVDLYRYDDDELQEAQKKLDAAYALNETVKKFIEEE